MILQLSRTIAQIKVVVQHRLAARRVTLFVALACATALSSEPVAAQATFTPLGQFGGVSSSAYDISADGSVIVGTTVALPGPTISLFRLTPQGSTVRSTGLTGSDFSREPSVSADGSTIVGTFQSPRGEEAFRWVGDGPFEALGDLPGGDFQSSAFGVSSDGNVVVGASEADSRLTAFRWTPGGGIASFGGNERTARAVSADGSVVGGGLWVTDQDAGPAYRWTAQTGSMEIPQLELPPLPLVRFLHAESRSMTPDGAILSVDVGRGYEPIQSSGAAFIWTAETGMISLRDALVFGGATNLDGWTLLRANGISADGKTVVGTAIGPGGEQAFVATIGAIPEPSTLVLTLIAVAALIMVATRNIWPSGTARKESLFASMFTSVDVTHFGAKGDGITDDAAAFQAAVGRKGAHCVGTKGNCTSGAIVEMTIYFETLTRTWER
jgi:probable HAF family extracellular repeat protein